MMLEIAIEADPEWDSSTRWAGLVRNAAEAAIAESDYPKLAESSRCSNCRCAWPATRKSGR
jgi:probable rRNA maturation factor